MIVAVPRTRRLLRAGVLPLVVSLAPLVSAPLGADAPATAGYQGIGNAQLSGLEYELPDPLGLHRLEADAAEIAQ